MVDAHHMHALVPGYMYGCFLQAYEYLEQILCKHRRVYVLMRCGQGLAEAGVTCAVISVEQGGCYITAHKYELFCQAGSCTYGHTVGDTVASRSK